MLGPVVKMALALAAMLPWTPASAQDYPLKTVRIVTSGAGGPSDIAARLIAQGISRPLGQAVLVDNRAAGNTVVEVVQKAPRWGRVPDRRC
jgi:tripartite-type tricarboxylate transporter receptor subunit TctC